MFVQVFAALLLGTLPLGQAGVSAGPITVKGCVQGSGSRITLSGVNPAEAFLLLGDRGQLAALPGHRVRITGSELPPDRAHAPRDMPRLMVKHVADLGGTCPPEGAEGSAQPSGISRSQAGADTPRYLSPGRVNPEVIPPGGAANVNRSAEGAPSAGTNDPRNLAKSPPPIPSEVENRTSPHSKKEKHKPGTPKNGTTTSPH